MDARPVIAETVGPVQWLRLNRPERLNALDPELMSELASCVDAAEADEDVRALVVTGTGRAFCSGGDLGVFRRGVEGDRLDDVVSGIEASGDALRRLAACRKPVIAAVNGVAVAGGLEIILCCDVVIAAAGALIGDGHLKYGVLPGGGGSVRLMRKLPPNIAKWLLLSAELVPAEKFAQWGLVNEVVDGEALGARAQQMAERLSALSPLALAQVKRVADYAVDAPLESALKLEQEAFAQYVTSADFAEGVRAFAAKTMPIFTGQ